MKQVVVSLAVALVVGGLAMRFAKGEHRENASGFPTVILILVVASAAGVFALQKFGIAAVNLITGNG